MAAPKSTQVTISFTKENTQPPIYVAGSFSDPAWEPMEMQYEVHDNVYHYHKQVEVETDKEYQYKFRIGTGDWWMTNEDVSTITDDDGNRNNLLQVSGDQADTTKSGNDSAAISQIKGGATFSKMLRVKPSRSILRGNSEQHVPIMPIFQGNTSQATDAGPSTTTHDEQSVPDVAAEVADTAMSLDHTAQSTDAGPDKIAPNEQSAPAVAAEVADTAQSLDQGLPSPPISDDEAGRTGYRRMSSTRAPEAARTAAEVADTAAKLDDGTAPVDLETPPSAERSMDSGRQQLPSPELTNGESATHVQGHEDNKAQDLPASPPADDNVASPAAREDGATHPEEPAPITSSQDPNSPTLKQQSTTASSGEQDSESSATVPGAFGVSDTVTLASNTATSTAKNSSSQQQLLKQRGGSANRQVERSSSPGAGVVDAGKRNPNGLTFLGTILRTVFVEWIGGFFSRLFGKGGQRQE